MAHSPEKKGQVRADLAAGMTVRDAAKKHRVSKSTVGDWLEELDKENKTGQKPDIEPEQARTNELAPLDRVALREEDRRNKMIATMDRFFEAAVDMLTVWAKEASDPAFIRKDTNAVLALGNAVLHRAERMCDRSKPEEDEPVEAEIVN
jgi:hypothetical protein